MGDETKNTPRDYSVYKRNVEIGGISKVGYSIFFPEKWDAKKIVAEIDSLCNNRKFVENTSSTYIGTASNGMKIKIFLDKNGKII